MSNNNTFNVDVYDNFMNRQSNIEMHGNSVNTKVNIESRLSVLVQYGVTYKGNPGFSVRPNGTLYNRPIFEFELLDDAGNGRTYISEEVYQNFIHFGERVARVTIPILNVPVMRPQREIVFRHEEWGSANGWQEEVSDYLKEKGRVV